MTTESRYHPEMMCTVLHLGYDFTNRLGEVHVGKLQSTDMTGCTAFFERIDAEVKGIRVVASGRPDFIYLKRDDKWQGQELPPR